MSAQMHRLLAEESVDQRMLEILARKELLFDEYVRKSDSKTRAPTPSVSLTST
jgi:hypothetical protein